MPDLAPMFRRRSTGTSTFVPPERHARNKPSYGIYNHKWKKMRKAFLIEYPLCKICLDDHDRHVAAEVVDHVIPHRADPDLFWDRSNLQSLCKRCHDRKTGRGA